MPNTLPEYVITLVHGTWSQQAAAEAGAPDAVVLARAKAEARVLLTLDKGIGDLRVYPPSQFSGIVLFRPPTSGREATLGFARKHLGSLLAVDLAGKLVVVTERGLRWR